MSIFNVGTGREPAEIGVAEYQKPDYQQFEKLANVNMQLKQAELEKAQKKTKEWGDILSTDFSTKYSIEQSRFVQKKIQAIKDKIAEKYKQNSNYLNDPVAMMEAKAELNQIKGFVGALDNQYATAIKDREEVEKDTKGIMYDKPYAIEYFNAQDNPLEYYNKNPNTEFGKKLGGIINSPEIQAIQDIDEKRFAIRSAMQAMPKKEGTINIARNITGKPDYDVSDPFVNGSTRGIHEAVTPVAALSFAMNGHANGVSENKPYKDYTKAQIIKEQGAENYENYLTKLKDDYTNFYNNAQVEYKDRKVTMDILNNMPSPDEMTEEKLLDYSWGRNKAKDYVTEKNTEIPRQSINIHNGGGTPKTSGSISAINKVSVPKVGGGYDEINIPETVIVPRKDDTEIRLDITYGMGADGSLFGVESSGSTANVQAKMGDSKLLIVPVYENKTWENKKTKIKHRIPLSAEDQQDMINNPSAWEGKVKFVTIITHRGETTQDGAKKVDNSFGYAKDNGTAFQAILKEAREQNYKGVLPTQVEYGLTDGLKIYNQLSAPKPF